MLNDFFTEYSERSDDELLLLASDRASLTTEAATALDAELCRRHLTEFDQVRHQQFVKRNEQRAAVIPKGLNRGGVYPTVAAVGLRLALV
jgi:hypothetical protein